MTEKKKLISKLKKPFRHSRTGSLVDSLKSHDDHSHSVDHSFHDDGVGDHYPHHDDTNPTPLPLSRKPPSDEAIGNFSRRLPSGNNVDDSFGSNDNWMSTKNDNPDQTNHVDGGPAGIGYFYDLSKQPGNLPRRISDSSYSRNSGEKQKQRYRDHTYVSPEAEDPARTTLDPKRFFDDQDEESFSSQNNPTSSSGGFNKYLSTFKPGNDNSSTAAIYGDTKENSPAVSLSPSRTGQEMPKTKLSSLPVTARDSDDNEPLDTSSSLGDFGPIKTNFRGQPTTLQDIAKNKQIHGDKEIEDGLEKKEFQRSTIPQKNANKDSSLAPQENQFAPIATHFRGQPTTLQDMASKAKHDSSSSSGTIGKNSTTGIPKRSSLRSSSTSSRSKPHRGRDLRYVDNDDASSEQSSTYSSGTGAPALLATPTATPIAASNSKDDSFTKGSLPKNPEPFQGSEIAELDKRILETMSQIKLKYVDPKSSKNVPRRSSSSSSKATGVEEFVGNSEKTKSEKSDFNKIAGVGGAVVAGAAAVAGGAIGADRLKKSTKASEPKDTYVSHTSTSEQGPKDTYVSHTSTSAKGPKDSYVSQTSSSAQGPKDTYISRRSSAAHESVVSEGKNVGPLNQSVDTKDTNKASENDRTGIPTSVDLDGHGSRGSDDLTDLSETKQSVVSVSRSSTINKAMPAKDEVALLGDEDNETYREAGGTLQDVVVTVLGTQDNDEAARVAKIAIEQLHDKHPDLLAESEELKIDYLSGAVIDQFGQKIAQVDGLGGPLESRYVKPSITRDPNRVYKGLQSDDIGPIDYHPTTGFIEELSNTEFPPNAFLASSGLGKDVESKTSGSKSSDFDSPDTSFVSTTQDTPRKPTSTIHPSTSFPATESTPLGTKDVANTQFDDSFLFTSVPNSIPKDINLNEASQKSQSVSASKDSSKDQSKDPSKDPSKDTDLEQPQSFTIPGSFLF
jgi:hypothetical protein